MDQALPGPIPHTPGNKNLASQKRPYKYFTAEEKAYLVHRGSLIDNVALTHEFNQQFSCSRTSSSIYQTLYHLRSDPVKQQEFAELAQSFEWYNVQTGSPSFTQEEKAFIVYQTSHGQRRKDILTGFDRQFSQNLLKSQIEKFLKNLDNESAQVLLVEAQKHKWFKTAPPPYDSREVKLGTFHWTAEQRAYVMILCDRGAVTRPTILSSLNSRFNIDCQLFDLKRLVHHVSIPRVKANLNELAPKYEWWTPEPMPGEKGYEQLQRRIKRVDAQARHKQKTSGFKLMYLNEEEGKASAWYTQSPHQTTQTSLSLPNSPAGSAYPATTAQDLIVCDSDDEKLSDDEDIDEGDEDEEHEDETLNNIESATSLALGKTGSVNINRTDPDPQHFLCSSPQGILEGYTARPGFSREYTSPFPDIWNTYAPTTPGATAQQATTQPKAERGSRTPTPTIQASPLHQMFSPSASHRAPSASHRTPPPSTTTTPHRERDKESPSRNPKARERMRQ